MLLQWGRGGVTKPPFTLALPFKTTSFTVPQRSSIRSQHNQMPAISDALLHRNDLQPLLLGASAASVHLCLAEDPQPRDEAMASAETLPLLEISTSYSENVASRPNSQNLVAFSSRRFFYIHSSRLLVSPRSCLPSFSTRLRSR